MSNLAIRASRSLGTMAVLCLFVPTARCAAKVQSFALADPKELVLPNVKAGPMEYQGRKAIRFTKDCEKDGFALLQGTDFQDGTIEADIARKTRRPNAGLGWNRLPGSARCIPLRVLLPASRERRTRRCGDAKSFRPLLSPDRMLTLTPVKAT